MKNYFKNIVLFFGMLFSLSVCANAQTFERKAKESTEEFLNRNFQGSSFIHYKIIENKLNTPGKKIIFFDKKIAMDSSINDSSKINCMFVNILVPENETSKAYSLQSFKIDCNREYDVTIDDATIEKDKQKNYFINILFVQLTRKSRALLIKTYKNFQVNQTSVNNFSIEEVKE